MDVASEMASCCCSAWMVAGMPGGTAAPPTEFALALPGTGLFEDGVEPDVEVVFDGLG